jgi:hypothetical protein
MAESNYKVICSYYRKRQNIQFLIFPYLGPPELKAVRSNRAGRTSKINSLQTTICEEFFYRL